MFFKKIFKALLRRLLVMVGFFMPINRKKICFVSYYGNGYGDNPKYICEELLKKGYRIIWFANKGIDLDCFPSGVEVCNSEYKWIIHLETSSVWVDNCRKSAFYKKKKTIYINTWHGSGMQKKAEKDAIGLSLVSTYEKKAKKDSKMIDFFVSDCKELTRVYKESFWLHNYILNVGFPRYAPIFNQNHEIRNEIAKHYMADPNSIWVLYAPTFRDNYDLSVYNLDYKKIKNSFKNKYHKDVVFFVKLHPNIVKRHIFLKNEDIIDVSNYIDTQLLLASMDILISDYSSIIFDFSLTHKPAFRYLPDLYSYNLERGLYYGVNEYPWPFAESNDSLSKVILDFNQEDYTSNIDAFLKKIGFFGIRDSGRLISYIIEDVCSGMEREELVKKYMSFLSK